MLFPHTYTKFDLSQPQFTNSNRNEETSTVKLLSYTECLDTADDDCMDARMSTAIHGVTKRMHERRTEEPAINVSGLSTRAAIESTASS